MNASLVSSLVTSIFLIFIIIGFIFGWFRGVSKSLTRLIIVLMVGVLSFFVVPPITNAILKLDISKLNIVLGDVQVMTVQDFVTDVLRQIPIVEDIIESSPTFENLIEIAPQIIVNVIFFIVLFFVFKWVSMLIYWIISGIFFSKKKMQGKDKHSFVGAVLGAIQGLMVVFILFVPFYGMVETVKPIANALEQEQTANTNKSEAFTGEMYYANSGELGETETSESNDALSTTIKGINDYTLEFDSVWVNKFLNFIGVKKLGVKMFEELTTVKSGELEISLMGEVKTISKAYPHLSPIINDGLDIENNEQLEGLKSAFNELYQSQILSNMIKEIVPEVANRWYNGYKFCEISKPTMDDDAMQVLFDTLLLNLSVAEGDSIKNDIDTTVDVLIIANNAQLIKTIVDDGDVLELLSSPENKNLLSDILSKALESKTLKAILPKTINVGMNIVYDMLGIDETTIADIEIDSNEINWDLETSRLQTIFNNAIEMYLAIQDGEETGETALENLDFKLLGETFDNIRFSTLLGPSSEHIMEALLNSSEIVGDNQETLAPFITQLKTAWSGTEPLAPTFETLGKALKLAKDLQTNVEDFNVDNLGDILTDLTNNDELKDVVNEVVNTDTLQKLGLNEDTANMVDETISTIINADYSEETGNSLEKEIEAVKEVYNVANKVLNLDSEDDTDKAQISSEESASLIGALAESTVLLDVVSKTGSGVENLKISENLTPESQDNLKAQIEALNTTTMEGKTEEEVEDIKNKLNSLFGF